MGPRASAGIRPGQLRPLEPGTTRTDRQIEQSWRQRAAADLHYPWFGDRMAHETLRDVHLMTESTALRCETGLTGVGRWLVAYT